MSRRTSSWSCGPADDLLEGGDEFPLVVDQAPQGGELGAAGQLADIPGVLGEDVVGALLPGGLAERGRVGARRPPAGRRPRAARPARRRRPTSARSWIRIRLRFCRAARTGRASPPAKKWRWSAARVQREVAAEEGVGGLEKVALGRVGRQLGDAGLVDRVPVLAWAASLWTSSTRSRVLATDLGEEQLQGARPEADPGLPGPRPGRPGRGASASLAAVGQREVRVLLAPLGERAPAVDRRGRDEDGGLRGIDGLQHLLEVLDAAGA